MLAASGLVVIESDAHGVFDPVARILSYLFLSSCVSLSCSDATEQS